MKIPHQLVLVICFAVLAGCTKAASEAENTDIVVQGESVKFTGNKLPESVATAAVSARDSVPITLTGRIVWNEDRTVRIFTPFAGRVTKILASLGDSVKKDQPLAAIESPDYGSAQADYRKAAAELLLAERNLERARDLHEHGVIAEKDLQQTESDAASADAEAQRTKRLLQAYGDAGRLIDQRLMLRSPIAGVVVERAINPGQELRPDQTSPAQFVVTDPSNLWIQLDAREDDLAALAPHTRFRFKVGAYPAEEFSAQVLRVSDYVDPVTRTIKVLAVAANPNRRLKGELFVTATIPIANNQQVEAPASAIILLGDKHYAFVNDKDTFIRREVTVGTERAGRVPILNGAKSGDVLVTQGALFLQQLLQSRAPS